MAKATGQAEEGEAGAEVPSEPEVAGFAKKLEQYRDTLPEDERPLVDGIVIASGVVEEDTTGHAWVQAWSAPGQVLTTDAIYWLACHARPGQQKLTFAVYGPWSGGFGTYRCYDWR